MGMPSDLEGLYGEPKVLEPENLNFMFVRDKSSNVTEEKVSRLAKAQSMSSFKTEKLKPYVVKQAISQYFNENLLPEYVSIMQSMNDLGGNFEPGFNPEIE